MYLHTFVYLQPAYYTLQITILTCIFTCVDLHVHVHIYITDLYNIQTYNHMEQYAEVVGNDASCEDYLRIAAYFQKNVDHFRAGQFFHKAGDYVKVRSYNFYF